MRFLNTTTLQLEEFASENLPPYAILSHTWEYDEEGTTEVTFGDFNRAYAKKLAGYEKIENTSRLARSDGFQYVWMDTCCIDRSSSELPDMINSMYRWFQEAEICYVYLADASSEDISVRGIESAMSKSKWFTRGWTLQELVAPRRVMFVSAEWLELGTKADLKYILSGITGIPINILLGDSPRTATAAHIFSWASLRTTQRVEDRAYSLLGIFGITMPIIYGEGDLAFIRLQEEILRTTGDQSLFEWGSNKKNERALARYPDAFARARIPSLRPILAAAANLGTSQQIMTRNNKQESTSSRSRQSEAWGLDGVFNRTNSNTALSSLFSNETIPQTVVTQFLAILVSDTVLSPLYMQALRGKTWSERKLFEARFLTLLENYRLDLLAQNPDVEEKAAIGTLRQYKKQFARYISEQFDLDDKSYSAKWTTLISQEPDKLTETEGYLTNLNTLTDDAQENEVRESTDNVIGNEKSFPNYERLRGFLLEGPAISNLRNSLLLLAGKMNPYTSIDLVESGEDETDIEDPCNWLATESEETSEAGSIDDSEGTPVRFSSDMST